MYGKITIKLKFTERNNTDLLSTLTSDLGNSATGIIVKRKQYLKAQNINFIEILSREKMLQEGGLLKKNISSFNKIN